MAKKPSELPTYRSTPTETILNPGLVTEIVDSLEIAIDLALGAERGAADDGYEYVFKRTSEYPPLTSAVFIEFKRRYQKSEANPQGWSLVTISEVGDRILVALKA